MEIETKDFQPNREFESLAEQTNFSDLLAKADAELKYEGGIVDIGLRQKWSDYLFVLLLTTVLFQLLLTIAVGMNLLDFTKYERLLYLIVGENFLQIVGMAIIVVRYLFPAQPAPHAHEVNSTFTNSTNEKIAD